MNESRERYLRTIDEWARSAIREMLRSPDPVAVYRQQDAVIRRNIKWLLSSSARASESVVSISLSTMFLTALSILLIPIAIPLVSLPIAMFVALGIGVWRNDRRARVKDAVLLHDRRTP